VDLLVEAARAEGAGEDGGTVLLLQPMRFEMTVQTLGSFEKSGKKQRKIYNKSALALVSIML
jgi:hypothetical protein